MNFIPLNGWPQLKDIPEKLEHFREVYARFAKVNRWYRSIEETELTGNPVIFDKALKLNALELNVDLLPIQSGSGDPSPTNVRPISGRTAVNLGRSGKNLYNNTAPASETTVYGVKFTPKGDGTIEVSGTPTGYAMIRISNFACNAAMGNVTFSIGEDATNIVLDIIRLYDSSDTMLGEIGNSVKTVSVNLAEYPTLAYATIAIKRSSNGVACSGVVKPQVEVGNVATPYEPYIAPVTLTIALGQTVYGGSLNVTTGVLTITHKYYLIEAFGSKSSSTDVDQYLYTVTESKSGAIPICNKCLGVDAAHIFDPTITAPVCGFAATTPTVFRFSLPTSMEIDTLEKVNEYIGDGLQICYELATPTTVQLTGEELEMLKGYNYISTDADSLTVKAYTI